MTPHRRAALLAGALYLVTFASSIPAVALLAPLLDDPGYVLGAGSDAQVLAGTALDVINAVACIGTAVVLFPVLRRRYEAAALGFVAARLTEAAIILIGVVCLVAVVTLRQSPPEGADDASLLAVSGALVAVRDATFLLGPGLVPAINAALLGSMLLRSGLVPRVIPLVGLVGAPLVVLSVAARLFGMTEPTSPFVVLTVLPIALWELALGVWLVARGFRAE